MTTIPIAEQIACVRREIRQRERVYARLVENGRMHRDAADREIAAMIAVLATLQDVQRAREPGMFA